MEKQVSFQRFRVDPRKIRISVRKVSNMSDLNVSDYYRVKATDISGKRIFASWSERSAVDAVLTVLDEISNQDIDGVDTDLMRTYPHPQFKELA